MQDAGVVLHNMLIVSDAASPANATGSFTARLHWSREPNWIFMNDPNDEPSNDEPPLVFLATSYTPQCTLRLDKRLSGYHTMQFMAKGSGGLFVAYDNRTYNLVDGQAWFWPAYPGPRLRFTPAPPFASWFHRHVGFTGRWFPGGSAMVCGRTPRSPRRRGGIGTLFGTI